VPELPEVTQEFTADTDPYIAAIRMAAAAANDFADANVKAIASIDDLSSKMDELAGSAELTAASEDHLREISATLYAVLAELKFTAADLRDTLLTTDAGFALLSDQMDSVIAHSAAMDASLAEIKDQLADIGQEAVISSAITIEALNRMGDAMTATAVKTAAVGAAAAAAGRTASAAAGFWQRWGGVIHWVVAAGAEFLAVFIPAMVAATAAAFVMLQGISDLYDRFMAMFDAQEALANIFHETTGEMVGMKDVLQAAQNAIDPHIFELLGAAINIAKNDAGGFVNMGVDVVNMLDEFAAHIEIDLTKNWQQFSSLLSGGARDLMEFGQILGNVGHAILNLAGDMPGLAHVLLAFFDIVSHVLLVLTSMPGIIVTVAMAMEEFWRWGGLLATVITFLMGVLTRLPLILLAVANALGTVSMRLMIAVGGGIADFVTGMGKLLESAGAAILGLDIFTGDVNLAEAAMMVGAAETEAFGAALIGLGAAIDAALEMLTPFKALLILAAVTAFVIFGIKAASATDALERWNTAVEEAVQRASSLNVMRPIIEGLGEAASLAAQGQVKYTQALQQGADVGAEVSSRYDGVGTAMGSAAQKASQAASAQTFLTEAMRNTSEGADYLAHQYGTTYIGALELADMAGVKLQDGIIGTGEAATTARLKIANYVTGMDAMAVQSGVVGTDVTLLGNAAELTGTKVQQLNEAFSQFVDNMVGGTSDLGAFTTGIKNIGQVAEESVGSRFGAAANSMNLSLKGIQQALTGFGTTGSQVWQNFDAALSQSASSLVQWFQTAGAEGAVTGPQFVKAMEDIDASFVQFAQDSPTAQKELVGFAEAQGLNIKTFPQLEALLKSTGADSKSLAGIVEETTGKMSDLNFIAQQLGATIGTDVVNSLNAAKIAASGLTGAAENLAKAWDHEHEIDQGVIQGFEETYQKLFEVYGNTHLAETAADAYARSLGLTQAQVLRLNRYIQDLIDTENRIPRSVYSNVYVLTHYSQVGQAPTGGHPGIHAQHGGIVPGGGFADSVPALLTPGEGILTRAATAALGASTIAALNTAPQAVLRGGGLGGLNAGGTIELHLKVDTYMDTAKVATLQRTQTLIYNRRNPSNNLSSRIR
jgi:hypothetical protein